MSDYDSMKDPKNSEDLLGDPAESQSGLDRRGFLKISSAVAATAAVAGTTLAESPSKPAKSLGKPREAGATQDLKGGWFKV